MATKDNDATPPYDGKDTVLDRSGESLDPEDKETELWAPVGRKLFGDNPGEPESEQLRTTEEVVQPDSDGESDPEDQDTELMSEEDVADTVRVSPHDAAAAYAEAMAEAEQEAARLLSDTVEVSGEEGLAARRLAEEALERRDSDATMVVDRPNLPKLSHECRMCGRKVTGPSPRRLRGSTNSEIGFRCEKCSNVFCAFHVVRVSGLWESLFHGGRFRCQLCLPRAIRTENKQ